jgi:hypothetical protein
MLARRAFDQQAQSGVLGDAAEPEVWRKEQQLRAVGKSSLTACCNKDYLALKARFQDLAGEHVTAFRNHLRAENEPRAWALAKLRRECAAAADVLPRAWDYAAGFLHNKRGVSIEECPEKDIWHAIFTVRRRAAQLRRAAERERGSYAGV